MRALPRSLSGRLLAISAITTIVALAFAAFSIGHVLERFVIRGLDQQLDAQVAMLVRAVRSDGVLDGARVIELPPFADREPGWSWRVDGPRGSWVGGDGIGAQPIRRPRPAPPFRDAFDRDRTMPGESMGSSGEPVHLRERSLDMPAGTVRILAAGPRRLVDAPLRAAMAPLLGSLAIVGVALGVAVAAQLRIGLRPLRDLQAALADVRAGRARHIPPDQPDELAPLAAELNGLVDQQQAQLDHARRHVANLAHGLKTPLAALHVTLADSGRDPDGALRAIVANIDGRIRHHLGRARAATPGGGRRQRTMLRPALDDLVAVMQGIHADRPIAATLNVTSDLAAAVDPQDLDEMLGNLLDNAWRHASGRVAISASRVGATIRVAIDDDGPGLSPAAAVEALVPGRRLDERGDGHGFGLPIAQELAELNGGALTLGTSPLADGLRVTLTLPTALADRTG